MAFVNFSSVNGEDFITIQNDVNVIKLDLKEFSHLMMNLQGLEAELVKKVDKIVRVKLKLLVVRGLNLRKE